MKTICIHQPNFLPFFGFFQKIMKSDFYIAYDDCQYEKQDFTNRVRIRTHEGVAWLTIPTVRSTIHGMVRDVETCNYDHVAANILKTIYHNYSKSVNFKRVFIMLVNVMTDREYKYLFHLNMALIRGVLKMIGYRGGFMTSSSLAVTGTGTDKIIGLVKAVGGDAYLAGGLGYERHLARIDNFNDEGIALYENIYSEPIYDQLHGAFIERLSIIDFLMNYTDDYGKAFK